MKKTKTITKDHQDIKCLSCLFIYTYFPYIRLNYTGNLKKVKKREKEWAKVVKLQKNTSLDKYICLVFLWLSHARATGCYSIPFTFLKNNRNVEETENKNKKTGRLIARERKSKKNNSPRNLLFSSIIVLQQYFLEEIQNKQFVQRDAISFCFFVTFFFVKKQERNRKETNDTKTEKT